MAIPKPTKNALKIHHFKGPRKFRLRAAVKLIGINYLEFVQFFAVLGEGVVVEDNVRVAFEVADETFVGVAVPPLCSGQTCKM